LRYSSQWRRLAAGWMTGIWFPYQIWGPFSQLYSVYLVLFLRQSPECEAYYSPLVWRRRERGALPPFTAWPHWPGDRRKVKSTFTYLSDQII
jgi:hypothetical protein